jgi:uncharacterized protein (TIGR03435 family)
MRANAAFALFIFGAFCGVSGQSVPQPRSFEVASIRPHPPPMSVIGASHISGPRLSLECFSVAMLIGQAYDLRDGQLSLPASNLRDIYFDIVAKAEGDGAVEGEDFRPMLQSLLAERFQLRFHREMREIPVYVLVQGRSGPKFQASLPNEDSRNVTAANGRNQILTLSTVTMNMLANFIRGSFFVDRPILDKTGLAGTYDIKIEATPEIRINREASPDDISIFTAVQQQLGLRLDGKPDGVGC